MNLIDELTEKRKKLNLTNPSKDKDFTIYATKRILGDREIVKEIKKKPWLLIEVLLTIVNKKKKTVPFFLNTVQKEFLEKFQQLGTEKPYFILKGRQQGFTTLITAMQLCFAITRRNFTGFTVADCTDNVNAIFNDKAKTVYNALPKLMKPHEKYNTRRELFFDKLNSSWRISCAGDGAGRSRTLEFAHFSEVAFYDTSLSEMQKSVGEALTQDAVIIYETTANGYNEAKDLWDSGSCNNLFFEWWKTDEYRIQNTAIINEVKDKDLVKRIEWLKKSKGLDENQIAWYVNKYNSYLDKTALKQEYPCTPEEAFVSSGECEFDKDAVVMRLSEINNEPIRGDFIYKINKNNYGKQISEIMWMESNSGNTSIYIEPNALDTYVIGADTAGGNGGDYYTAVVERVSDAKTVATFRNNRIDEDLFAHQLFCLGKMYNDAKIAVEVNFSTTPLRELIETEYPNLFARGVGIEYIGFKTTSVTRPLIINTLKALFREDPTIELSKEILMEMLSFVRGKTGRPEALVGKHDDLVMAKAIAHYVRESEAYSFETAEDNSFIKNNFNIKPNIKKIEW